MTTVFTRTTTATGASNQNAPLTSAQVDANFINLNADKAPLTGEGTSGTWGISITGNAATATNVAWTGITGKPAVIAEGADAAAARAAIGAGTSSLVLGTTAGTALAGNTVVLPDAPSDGKTYGRKNAAWAEAAPIANPTFTGTVNGITKAMVGLGNVDNTSDANKPVSTATQTALNLKANLESPTFTGVATFPSSGGVFTIQSGTGDGASTTVYNTTIRSWWGIGFRDYTDSATVKAYIDCRSGVFAGQQLTSLIATGTAPLVVASTTAVANLNADLLDGQHGSFYAPIASPTFTGYVRAVSGAASTGIAAMSSATPGFESMAQGSAATAGAATITFHRPGAYAVHFGLDTDNKLKVGGWSLGAAAYSIYHEGNKPTKTDVGLSNVDNTSDANKPISTATQTALNDKVTGQSSSVDGEIALFSGTGGKTIKRSALDGIIKSAAGVASAAVAGTDYVAPEVATTFTAQQTFKEVKDTVYAITDGNFAIDPGNGSIQIVTIGTARTPTAANFEAGQIVLLGIQGNFTITWSSVAVTWIKAGGTASAPNAAASGYLWVMLWKVGTTIYGTEVGKV